MLWILQQFYTETVFYIIYCTSVSLNNSDPVRCCLWFLMTLWCSGEGTEWTQRMLVQFPLGCCLHSLQQSTSTEQKYPAVFRGSYFKTLSVYVVLYDNILWIPFWKHCILNICIALLFLLVFKAYFGCIFWIGPLWIYLQRSVSV